MRPIKYLILIAIFSLVSAAGVIANADDGSKRASDFVDSNAKKVLDILQSSDKASERINLIALFLQVMDYEWMAKFAIGRHWEKLLESEQREYLDAYKNYLVSIYVPKYEEYNKQTYRIYASNSLGNGQYQVSMNISSPNSRELIKVEYRLKDYSNNFKIRDIVAEGISLLATQRADFSAFLSNSSIQNLIASLKSKSLS